MNKDGFAHTTKIDQDNFVNKSSMMEYNRIYLRFVCGRSTVRAGSFLMDPQLEPRAIHDLTRKLSGLTTESLRH